MRIAIPFNDAFPQYMLEVITPAGVKTVTVDDSHRVIEVALPESVSEDDVELLGCPLTRQGLLAPGYGPVVLKQRVERPVPPRVDPVAELYPADQYAVESTPERLTVKRKRTPKPEAVEPAAPESDPNET